MIPYTVEASRRRDYYIYYYTDEFNSVLIFIAISNTQLDIKYKIQKQLILFFALLYFHCKFYFHFKSVIYYSINIFITFN